MRHHDATPMACIIRRHFARWTAVLVAAMACVVQTSAHGEQAEARPTTRRTGVVRLAGRSLADDGGKFTALGASLFYGAWAYKNDRPRLERTLATLARHGFDYVRVLGVVGDPNAPDSWD